MYKYQVLLECVGRTDSKVVFKYYLSDRRDAMAQSILSKESEFFILHIGGDSIYIYIYIYIYIFTNIHTNIYIYIHTYYHIDGDSISMKDYRGKGIQLSAVFFIGKNILDYIRQYLEYKGRKYAYMYVCIYIYVYIYICIY
jgi:hypothetical protein